MIDRGTCKAMLRESARLMLEQADRLSDIDSKFGDGDHGITITKIAKLMDERAEAWDEESIKDFLDDLGMAAMAVRGGLDPEEALKAITLNGARLAGVADRVGSLTPGKDADVVVTTGHPLDWMSMVAHVFIDGVRVK